MYHIFLQKLNNLIQKTVKKYGLHYKLYVGNLYRSAYINGKDSVVNGIINLLM